MNGHNIRFGHYKRKDEWTKTQVNWNYPNGAGWWGEVTTKGHHPPKKNWVGKTFYILIVVVVTWVYFFGQSHNIAPFKWVQRILCKLFLNYLNAVAAKSLQSCPTLCSPIDGSPPGSPVPGILQARTLKWVAISFSNAWKWKVKVKSLSRVWLFVTPWTAAYQVCPPMGFSRQEYWSGVPLPSPNYLNKVDLKVHRNGVMFLIALSCGPLTGLFALIYTSVFLCCAQHHRGADSSSPLPRPPSWLITSNE